MGCHGDFVVFRVSRAVSVPPRRALTAVFPETPTISLSPALSARDRSRGGGAGSTSGSTVLPPAPQGSLCLHGTHFRHNSDRQSEPVVGRGAGDRQGKGSVQRAGASSRRTRAPSGCTVGPLFTPSLRCGDGPGPPVVLTVCAGFLSAGLQEVLCGRGSQLVQGQRETGGEPPLGGRGASFIGSVQGQASAATAPIVTWSRRLRVGISVFEGYNLYGHVLIHSTI